MKSPIALSVWFVSCVSIGLFMAWVDGVEVIFLLQAGLIATGVALILALLAWVTRASKVDRSDL